MLVSPLTGHAHYDCQQSKVLCCHGVTYSCQGWILYLVWSCDIKIGLKVYSTEAMKNFRPWASECRHKIGARNKMAAQRTLLLTIVQQ